MRIVTLDIRNSGSRLHSIAVANTRNYVWVEVYRISRLCVINSGGFFQRTV